VNELVRLFFEPREQCFLAKHHELLTTNLYREDQVRPAVSDVDVGFGAQTSENFFSAFYTAEADGMGVGLAVRRSKVGALLSFLVGFLPSPVRARTRLCSLCTARTTGPSPPNGFFASSRSDQDGRLQGRTRYRTGRRAHDLEHRGAEGARFFRKTFAREWKPQISRAVSIS
jgi:hypothetical protein